jgi:hypothetical protein
MTSTHVAIPFRQAFMQPSLDAQLDPMSSARTINLTSECLKKCPLGIWIENLAALFAVLREIFWHLKF